MDTTEQLVWVYARIMMTWSFCMISLRECQRYIGQWMKESNLREFVKGVQGEKSPNLREKLDHGIASGENNHGVIPKSLG